MKFELINDIEDEGVRCVNAGKLLVQAQFSRDEPNFPNYKVHCFVLFLQHPNQLCCAVNATLKDRVQSIKFNAL